MHGFGDVLDPEVTALVAAHVRSVVTWDILALFHRNPEAVSDLDGLAARLGRRVAEVRAEVYALCESRILSCAGGLIRYRPDARHRAAVGSLVRCGDDQDQRRALVALLVGTNNPTAGQGV